MAGNAGLRLPENIGQIRNGELALRQQRQDAQPCLLASRAQARKQG